MRILSNLLDLVYPPRCILCERILDYNISRRMEICEDCIKENQPIGEPRCKICSRPIPYGVERCDDCKQYNHEYTQGWALWIYEDKVKEAIYRLKYGELSVYGKTMGAYMVRCFRKEYEKAGIHCIIPVPIHPKRKRRRGFNQAQSIGEEISREMNIPIFFKVLHRTKDTKPNSGLSYIARRENIKGAFEIREREKIEGKNILIIDDIYTTGSTIDACAEILKYSGAEKVYFTTVSIGVLK